MKSNVDISSYLDPLVSRKCGVHNGIIGQSPKMRAILTLVRRISNSEIPICLFGESGTGKELIARAIHAHSQRREQPFVPINCSAIPEGLLEAELFGYARGAFTGAEEAHSGYFVMANGGTLFLDEVADMSLAMQAKLLRVLEDHLVRPLGARTDRRIDVRIVTASNRNIKTLVAENAFREDLFFRICGIHMTLPPLRDRKEDIPLLTNYFIERFCIKGGIEKKVLSREAADLLLRYTWPGNVRELESIVYNACVLSEDNLIQKDDFAQNEELLMIEDATLDGRGIGAAGVSLDDSMGMYEGSIISQTLQKCRGNVSRAAKNLKIPRQRLYRLIKKHNIDTDRL